MSPISGSSSSHVLFEDDRLIVVDKPASQAMIPGRNLGKSFHPLGEIVAKKMKKKAWVVHRLDRETSGIVVFAKDAQTYRELCLLWEKWEVKKFYRALVQGYVPQTEGVIEFPLKPFGSGRMGVCPQGKPSRTRYRVLQRFSGSTLVEVEPWSGRRHQIRVHFYHMGHPVMGDPLYGKERPVGGARRLMLHASQISLRFQGHDLNPACEPGEDFEGVLREVAGFTKNES